MSYILDALRRADAERDRGAVPGLHAQQSATADDEVAVQRRSRLVAVVIGLAALLVASVAWQWFGRDTPAPAVVAVAPPAAAPGATPDLPPPPAAQRTAPSTGAATADTALGGAPPAQVLPGPVPVPDVPRRALPAPATVQPPAAATPPTASRGRSGGGADGSVAPKAGSASATAAAADRVESPEQLPADIQRDMPKLVVGGSIYSSDPASRFVVLNGQIYHEGDKPAPGMVLERIELKSAVLSYKGHRFGISY